MSLIFFYVEIRLLQASYDLLGWGGLFWAALAITVVFLCLRRQ